MVAPVAQTGTSSEHTVISISGTRRRVRPITPGVVHTGAVPAALRSRPTAETFALDDLVGWAWQGRIRIPSFQRGLRWSQRDVVQLFDSILNGYPIGSLLFWEREALAETVTLGPLQIDAPADTAFYVVDGQQRMTALAAALSPRGEDDKRFQVGYELSSGRYVARPIRESETYVPAHVLWDLQGLLGWFRDKPHLMDLFDAAAGVSKSLRDVKIPAYVVRQDDEDTLRTIFDRMNNAGKTLTRGEVFAALHRPAADDSLSFRAVGEQLDARTGFGALDEGVGMQIVLARRGPDVMREIRNEFERDAKGRDAHAVDESPAEAFTRGLDAAVTGVRFLQRAAGVPHLALLPYQHLLVTVVRLCGQSPTLTRRQERLLRRFFWRAAVGGLSVAKGNTTGIGRLLNRRIVPGDIDDSLSQLLAMVTPAHRPSYPDPDPFRANTAVTKMLLCAMWHLGPRSLSSGEVVPSDELSAALSERTTATDVIALLEASPGRGQDDAQTGGRLLLASAEDRSSDLLPLLEAASETALASHLLTRADVLALGDGADVATARTGRLAVLFAAFLDRMCEWDHEDTPDLDTFVVDEDELVDADATGPDGHGPD